MKSRNQGNGRHFFKHYAMFGHYRTLLGKKREYYPEIHQESGLTLYVGGEWGTR